MKKALASKNQEQFWLLNRLSKTSSVYNIANLIKLDKLPDIKLLEEIFNDLIREHETFRTSFSFENGCVYQLISPPGDCPVKISYSGIASEIIEGEDLPPELYDEVHKPFDLKKPPLLRVHIYKNEQAYYLLIIFHHITIDLQGKDIFEREFESRYRKKIKNLPQNSEGTKKTYTDYSDWHNTWLQSKDSERMVEEWGKELPPPETLLELPIDFNRPKVTRLNGDRIFFNVSEPLSGKVHEYAIKHTSYSFIVMLTAYAILLHKISGQKHIVLGVPLSNRRNDEFKDIIGCFINIVPISIDFSQADTVDSVRKQIRNKLLLAHRKQEVPFLSLLNSSGPRRNTSYNPFYQTGFTFEPLMNIKIDGVKSAPVAFQKKGAQLDLFLTMWENNNQFCAYLEYSTDIFIKETVTKLKSAFIELLTAILAREDNPINELKINLAHELMVKTKSVKTLEKNIIKQRESVFSNSKVSTIIKILEDIWKDILKTSRLNHSDNFFDIGGNSLLAIEMVTRINSAFNTDFELVDIMELTNINSIASRIHSFAKEQELI